MLTGASLTMTNKTWNISHKKLCRKSQNFTYGQLMQVTYIMHLQQNQIFLQISVLMLAKSWIQFSNSLFHLNCNVNNAKIIRQYCTHTQNAELLLFSAYTSTVKPFRKTTCCTISVGKRNKLKSSLLSTQHNIKKLEIWGKAQRESARHPDWGENSGGGKISQAAKSHGPNSNALAYAERTAHCRLREGQHERV